MKIEHEKCIRCGKHTTAGNIVHLRFKQRQYNESGYFQSFRTYEGEKEIDHGPVRIYFCDDCLRAAQKEQRKREREDHSAGFWMQLIVLFFSYISFWGNTYSPAAQGGASVRSVVYFTLATVAVKGIVQYVRKSMIAERRLKAHAEKHNPYLSAWQRSSYTSSVGFWAYDSPVTAINVCNFAIWIASLALTFFLPGQELRGFLLIFFIFHVIRFVWYFYKTWIIAKNSRPVAIRQYFRGVHGIDLDEGSMR